MEKVINLLGEEVKFKYDLACQVCYEAITDKPFDFAALSKMENRMALYYSIIVSNNPETGIDMDKLLRETSMEDLSLMDRTANEVVSDWYRIPKPANLENEGSDEKNV